MTKSEIIDALIKLDKWVPARCINEDKPDGFNMCMDEACPVHIADLDVPPDYLHDRREIIRLIKKQHIDIQIRLVQCIWLINKNYRWYKGSSTLELLYAEEDKLCQALLMAVKVWKD